MLRIAILIFILPFGLLGHTQIPRIDSLSVREDSAAGIFQLYSPPLRESKKTVHWKEGVIRLQEKDSERSGWLLWLFLTEFLLFAMVRAISKSAYSELLRDITRYQLAIQRYAHRDTDPLLVDLPLRAIGLFNFSLFLWFYIQYQYDMPLTSSAYFLSVGTILLLYLAKKWLDKGIAWVVNAGDLMGTLQFYTDQLLKLFGISIYPILLLLAYSPFRDSKTLYYMGFVLIVAFIVIRYWRGYLISSSQIRRHFFHIILYICTLEIIPILLILKETISFLES